MDNRLIGVLGWIKRGWDRRSPTGKSQVAIGFLRKSGTDPFEKGGPYDHLND